MKGINLDNSFNRLISKKIEKTVKLKYTLKIVMVRKLIDYFFTRTNRFKKKKAYL